MHPKILMNLINGAFECRGSEVKEFGVYCAIMQSCDGHMTVT